MSQPRLRSTGGFWLLVGALLLVASGKLLVCFLVACLVHELGHGAAIRLLGGRVAQVDLTGVGVVLAPRREKLFSYWEEGVIALAGPTASFLLAVAAGGWARTFGGMTAYLLTGVSLALGVFNLLPAGPLDGGRILQSLLAKVSGPDTGERWGRRLTTGVGVLLTGGGLWAMASGGSFTLLLCALWLLFGGALQERMLRRSPRKKG